MHQILRDNHEADHTDDSLWYQSSRMPLRVYFTTTFWNKVAIKYDCFVATRINVLLQYEFIHPWQSLWRLPKEYHFLPHCNLFVLLPPKASKRYYLKLHTYLTSSNIQTWMQTLHKPLVSHPLYILDRHWSKTAEYPYYSQHCVHIDSQKCVIIQIDISFVEPELLSSVFILNRSHCLADWKPRWQSFVHCSFQYLEFHMMKAVPPCLMRSPIFLIWVLH